MPLLKQEQEYTYEEYLKWDEDERIEILDGFAYMQAAPSRIHQEILGEIYKQIAIYLTGKPCKVYPAPFCVRLDSNKKDKDIKNIVEPDITIVCDKSKLDDRGCKGSPDMVIEIVSPSSGKMDRVIKLNKYEEAGVKEYWIVDTNEKYIDVFKLQTNKRYGRHESFTDEEKIKVGIFPDLEIDLKAVFDF